MADYLLPPCATHSLCRRRGAGCGSPQTPSRAREASHSLEGLHTESYLGRMPPSPKRCPQPLSEERGRLWKPPHPLSGTRDPPHPRGPIHRVLHWPNTSLAQAPPTALVGGEGQAVGAPKPSLGPKRPTTAPRPGT